MIPISALRFLRVALLVVLGGVFASPACAEQSTLRAEIAWIRSLQDQLRSGELPW